MKEKDEIDEKDRKKIALTENNDADEIIIIKRKKRENSGPRIKKQKMNKTEDKELQIACEDKEEKKERLKEEKEEKEKEKLRKKEEELKNKNLIYRIDEQNYICADCEREKSIYISINNGVTICNTCAKEHQLLGHSISYIISINEKLDEYIFNFIVFGSNTRFKRFITNENIDNSLPIQKKYKTQALYFYRKTLKNKVLGIDLPLKEYENPNEIIENNSKDDYPEFNRYIIKKQIIENGQFKKESRLKNALSKLLGYSETKKKKNKVMLLRAKSSTNEELENGKTNNIEKGINFKKNPTRYKSIDELKGSSRHFNDNNETETEKSEENEETRRAHPTSEKIINNNINV